MHSPSYNEICRVGPRDGTRPQRPLRNRREVRGAFGGKRLTALAVVASAFAILALVMLPSGNSTARPILEGTPCGDTYSGCHDGAQTASMLTVTGLPGGSYVPGQPYTVTITITDTNGGATGENAFDFLVTGGTVTESDPNAETNTPPAGYAGEASADDSVSPMGATTWTVVWTAPASGSATVEVWAVMGDGAGGIHDIWDYETQSYSDIPEFPTLVLPLIGVLGILVVVVRFKRKAQ